MAKGLPALPPLPKAGRSTTARPRKKGSSNEPPEVWKFYSMSVEVEAEEGEDTRPGRWFRTTSRKDLIGGTCGECGRQVRALDLGWKIPPFEKSENGFWGCRDCRKDITLGVKGIVKRDFSRPVGEVTATIGGIEAMRSMLGDLINRNLPRLAFRWHPPMKLSRMVRPEDLGAAFTTAAHIANAISKERKEKR